jgi:hypothetical protein
MFISMIPEIHKRKVTPCSPAESVSRSACQEMTRILWNWRFVTVLTKAVFGPKS